MLLELLFREGRDGRMSKVFRQYVADCSPYRDPEFDELYLAGVLATRTSPVPLRRRDRFLLLVRQFEKTLELDGLVAECGCFRGLSSHILCGRLKRRISAFDGRGYRIFDSFRGLSEPQNEDALSADADPSRRAAEGGGAGWSAVSLASIAEAKGALAAIAEYYVHSEPSSPDLPLVRQAHQLDPVGPLLCTHTEVDIRVEDEISFRCVIGYLQLDEIEQIEHRWIRCLLSVQGCCFAQ